MPGQAIAAFDPPSGNCDFVERGIAALDSYWDTSSSKTRQGSEKEGYFFNMVFMYVLHCQHSMNLRLSDQLLTLNSYV